MAKGKKVFLYSSLVLFFVILPSTLYVVCVRPYVLQNEALNALNIDPDDMFYEEVGPDWLHSEKGSYLDRMFVRVTKVFMKGRAHPNWFENNEELKYVRQLRFLKEMQIGGERPNGKINQYSVQLSYVIQSLPYLDQVRLDSGDLRNRNLRDFSDKRSVKSLMFLSVPRHIDFRHLENVDLNLLHVDYKTQTEIRFSELLKVKSLGINNCIVTDQSLSKLGSIEELFITKSVLRGESFLPTSDKHKLIKLRLRKCDLKGVGGIDWSEYPSVHLLQVEECNVGHVIFNDSMSSLKLEQLYVKRMNVDERFLEILKDCKNLKYLSLSDTNVGDEVFAVLGSLSELKSVHLHYTNITKSAIATYKEKFPSVEVGY